MKSLFLRSNLHKRVSVVVMMLLVSLTLITKTVAAMDVVVGFAKPPYVIAESVSGFEIELVQHVVEKMGQQANFIFVPYKRSEKMLNDDMDIDAIMTVNQSLISNQSLLTKPYIHYQNVAISLQGTDVKLTKVADLSQYNVAAFALAEKVLGEDYAKAVTTAPSYSEIQDQKRQTKMLFQKRTDLLIMDLNIFRYYQKQLDEPWRSMTVKVHPIFPRHEYGMAFKNSDHVPLFEKAMDEFKSTEEYQALITKYALKPD